MINFILVVALGVFTIAFVLLFRRIGSVARRQARIDDAIRQLTDVHVELYRELLHLRRRSSGASRSETTASERPVAVGDHTGQEPEADVRPLRTKKHLRLLQGGMVAAAATALAEFLREAYRQHRSYVIGMAIGSAAAAAAATTVLTITPWQQDGHDRPQSSAPTAAPTAPASSSPPKAPGPIRSTLPSPPAGSPSPASASPSSSPPIGTAIPIPALPVVPAVPIVDLPAEVPVPAAPGVSVGITPPGEQAAEETASPTPVVSASCVSATPILDAEACLPVLGGG